MNLFSLPTGWLRRSLRAHGFEIRRITPRPLQEPIDEIPTALLDQAAYLGRSVLANVPLGQCRDVLGARPDENPFVAACKEPTHARETLGAYYGAFQPVTAADVLGLAATEAPGLAGLPALSFVYPWEAWSPADAIQHRVTWIEEEARTHGFDLGPSDGSHHFGPVTGPKVDMEATRLKTLLERIAAHGYQRSDAPDGDVQGSILVNDEGHWCLHAGSGQHRLAVTAALGQATLPVRIERAPITRATVGHWPHVVSGFVTETGALSVFDRFLEGRHPGGTHAEPVRSRLRRPPLRLPRGRQVS